MAALDAVSYPSVGPAFDRVVVGTDGAIWVNATPLAGEPERWRVLDAGGVAVRMVELPAGGYLVEAGARHLVAVQTDQDDVQTVVVYRWKPGGTGPSEPWHPSAASGT